VVDEELSGIEVSLIAVVFDEVLVESTISSRRDDLRK
jgi:hypothetical protein